MSITAPVPAPSQSRRPKRLRFFFVSMAFGALAITLAAFVPEYQQFSRGKFPIPALLHVHAAIMAAWVLAFFAQAWFIARGRVQLHRSFGRAAFVLATVGWLSMIMVEVRALAVHAPPGRVSDYDWLLPGPYVYLTIPVLLAWGYRERRRPDWHKRFMIIAPLAGEAVKPASVVLNWQAALKN